MRLKVAGKRVINCAYASCHPDSPPDEHVRIVTPTLPTRVPPSVPVAAFTAHTTPRRSLPGRRHRVSKARVLEVPEAKGRRAGLRVGALPPRENPNQGAGGAGAVEAREERAVEGRPVPGQRVAVVDRRVLPELGHVPWRS